jgi:hypothetical protein
MFNFIDLVSFLGVLLRLAGLLVFGVAAGWFTLFTFRQPEGKWQLQAAAYLGFVTLSALIIGLVSPGGVGAYALGAGVTLLYLGKQKTAQGGEPAEPEATPTDLEEG